ncbi:MAG: phosphodiester glycosidase family protein, partial [Verrucomicrobiota bacterium]
DPDIRLLTTPPLTNAVENSAEVAGMTVSGFLRTNGVQAAINANFFDPSGYYLPAGTPMDVHGLSVSQGVVVSPQDSPPQPAAVLLFDAQNHPTFVPINWPSADLSQVYTAVCGDYPVLVGGVISRVGAREADPRTIFGLSADRRFLFVVAIDGRQPGYSQGANDYESGAWLQAMGASDAINLDGGGSTTLVVQDSLGAAVRLNQPSAVADSGRERTVGSHLGIFAKPLLGFINDVAASPDETSTQVRWTTVAPATSEVQYGTTADLGASSGSNSELVTEHLVSLSGLSPATDYYFRVLSSAEGEDHASATFLFHTTNYVTATEVFNLTNAWRWAAGSASSDWANASFADTEWQGPSPGLLWIDTRPTGPNPSVEPKNTLLPSNPATAEFPYLAYYFRTHFNQPEVVAGTKLSISGYIDDGAIFYLNGTEILRLRMPDSTGPEVLATGYPCDGDATCLDELVLPESAVAQLRAGDNVLAVEVHNYSAGSRDITFGLTLNRIEPARQSPTLEVTYALNQLTITWSGNGYVLENAESLLGPWSLVATASPYATSTAEAHRYFRLRK